jgi:subtilisin family serine protease
MLRLPAKHFRPDGGYGGSYMNDSGSAARRRIASALAASHGLHLRDSWAMPAIGVDCFVMEADAGVPLERVLTALSGDQRVAWAQALSQYQGMAAGVGTSGTGSDPLYPIQPAAHDWHLSELHRISTGRNVLVAVVDSGVDASHPDLAGQLGLRRNFVDDSADAAESHGTAVAGIIGARAGNGIGISGVAPGVKLMALRACWETGGRVARCNSLTLAKAINFALENRARIINLSLAGPADRLLQSLLDAALARGIVVIGAADPQLADGGFPASHPGVIAIARRGDKHPLAANLGYAPGTDIPTCKPGAAWGLVSGSSYAAAHVAGLAALLTELRPRDTAQALRSELSSNSVSSTALASSTGNIDACAALARAASACVCLCSPSSPSSAVKPSLLR